MEGSPKGSVRCFIAYVFFIIWLDAVLKKSWGEKYSPEKGRDLEQFLNLRIFG